MIKSMTGFGRCEVSEGDRKFTVEMKGVNHRYLDANIRMTKKLNFFEAAIRNLLKECNPHRIEAVCDQRKGRYLYYI